MDIDEIGDLQKQEGTDIYLCGGGQFAGWLLDNKKIDTEVYENGLQIMTYKINYDIEE